MSKTILPKSLPPLSCYAFEDLKSKLDFASIKKYTAQDFKKMFTERLQQCSHSKIIGLENFPQQEIMSGCQHFIDNLIWRYGIENIQTFEHDYHYYHKINPNIKYATIDTLDKDKPLILASPFPGHLDTHRDFEKIIKKCEEVGVKVYIDGAWFPSSFDLVLNLSSPVIQEVGFSCSKAYDMSDNRIGIRYSKNLKANDSINYMNTRQMYSKVCLQIACIHLENFQYDHLVSVYKENYFLKCKELKLRPSKIIHAVFSLDWQNLYGIKQVLKKL